MIANSKNKARTIILTAFILGVLTGVGGMSLVGRGNVFGRGGRAPMIEDITREVGLNQEQRAQVEAILKQTRQESHQIFKPIQQQMLELRSRSRAQIRAVLTPDQQARYDAWTRQRDAAHEAREKGAPGGAK
jgi:Spy/CpxP family protein refolding chaperone